MNPVFGIDLGTTNSVISELRDGRPMPIPIAGSPIVPSVVLLAPDRVAVGREARNLELQFPELTIRSVKRKMGQPHRYTVRGREYSPEEISAEILRALKQGAEAQTGQPVHEVVITVPAYFNDAQRRATLTAGELAGLSVLRLLNEPTSASLVYDQIGGVAEGEAEIVLIYDLGGGTFDVSVLEVFEGVREVRATTGNTALGGDDFDEHLVRFFLDELKRNQGIDPREDLRAMARLRSLAEETKIRLSQQTEVQVREEFLTSAAGRSIHLDVPITRRQFEDMIRSLLTSTIDLAKKAVSEANLLGQSISRICLVGGSTRIPLVRTLLESAFDAEIHEEIDPDLAVGLGASIQAGLLKGAEVQRILVDVTAHTMGIRVVGSEDINHMVEPDTYAPVLRRNTALPAERTEEFYTMVDGQEALLVEVFQGEAARVSQNTPVGSFHYPLTSRPAHSPVQVKFSYDLNGVVKVLVSQPGTTNEKTVAFKVADAGKQAQLPAAAHPAGEATQGGTLPPSAVERKARALLDRLSGGKNERLSQLLADYTGTSGTQRELAEEKLLDFFLDHEAEAADLGEQADPAGMDPGGP